MSKNHRIENGIVYWLIEASCPVATFEETIADMNEQNALSGEDPAWTGTLEDYIQGDIPALTEDLSGHSVANLRVIEPISPSDDEAA